MLFLKYQVFDSEDVVYTVIPAEPLRQREVVKAIFLLKTYTKRQNESEPARCLIVFPFGKNRAAVGFSNSTIQDGTESLPLLRRQNRIYLENAVKTRYEGPFKNVWNGISNLEKYLQDKGFRSITSVYCVMRTEIPVHDEEQDVILDLYAGVDKNVVLDEGQFY